MLRTNQFYRFKLNTTESKNKKNYSRIIQQFEFNRDKDTKIRVTVRENKVIIQLYKRGAEKPYLNAVAKCHPIDNFDLEKGIKIAMVRLKEKEEMYNKKNNKHYMIDKRTNERYETGIVVFKDYKVGQTVLITYHDFTFVDFIKDNKRTLIYNIPLNKASNIKPFYSGDKKYIRLVERAIVDFI